MKYKDSDVMIRTDKVLNDLYNTINTEDWTVDEKLYNKEIDRFVIVSNLVGALNQYIYNKNTTKDEIKELICNLIDKNL